MSHPSDGLLLAVGQALQTWGALENNLTDMFANLSDIPHRGKAFALFDTIISFETKADVIDTLMSIEKLTALEHETWRRFSAQLRKHYKKRHEIAHFGLVGDTTKEGDVRYKLSPFLSLGGIVRGQVRTLTTKEIQARKAKFLDLNGALWWFSMDVETRRGRRPSNPMQAPPLVLRLRELAAQILEERERKQQKPPAQ